MSMSWYCVSGSGPVADCYMAEDEFTLKLISVKIKLKLVYFSVKLLLCKMFDLKKNPIRLLFNLLITNLLMGLFKV